MTATRVVVAAQLQNAPASTTVVGTTPDGTRLGIGTAAPDGRVLVPVSVKAASITRLLVRPVVWPSRPAWSRRRPQQRFGAAAGWWSTSRSA
ncbi:hypothetical protein [Leekyejoonella antrihumi]|uniref:Uncharacterized protein n=1 Tax=Leekyejoonella antrihumi TaxID=1660198 RepID=A0A563DYE3_9MICO|nr:hypothetical protein [Leekyejoonella antrihumi]TWP34704.1 hypothetical protein FGL98_16455 [Leekyejoonella antrihumi]